MALSEKEYEDCQQSLALIASLASELPLKEFIAKTEVTLEHGELVDAAKFAKIAPKLRLIFYTAKKCYDIQRAHEKARDSGVLKGVR